MKDFGNFAGKDAQPDNTDDSLTTNECVTTGRCPQEPPGTPEGHNANSKAPIHNMNDEPITDYRFIVDEPIADVYGPIPPLLIDGPTPCVYGPPSWYDEDRTPESEETGKRNTFLSRLLEKCRKR